MTSLTKLVHTDHTKKHTASHNMIKKTGIQKQLFKYKQQMLQHAQDHTQQNYLKVQVQKLTLDILFILSLEETHHQWPTLTAPNNQIKFPTPDNLLKTNSLQSPTLPIEYYLYGFDQRRHELTKKAFKRIKTNQETETPLLPITDSTPDKYWTPDETTSTSESETEKEKEEDLHYQLLKQRKCQKQLRHRIKQLLNRLTNIE